jgi:cell division protease FtsH
LVAAAILAYRDFDAAGSQILDQSSFYDAVMKGRVKKVTMVPDGIGFEIRDTLNSEDTSAERFVTYVLADRNLTRILSEERVSVKAEAPRRGSVLSVLGPWIFLLIFGAVFVFFMRRMQQGVGQVLSLRRSRAKLSSRTGKITFKDVAGVEEANQELQEIVEFLEEPDEFQKLGGRIPTGVLLRPGRFERQIAVDRFDLRGREQHAGMGRKREVGKGLSMFPKPGLRPA